MRPPADDFERLPLFIALIAGGATLIVVGAAYWWLKAGRPLLNPGGSRRLGHVLCDGAVRRRHAKTIQWSTLEDRDPVFLRDLIYTLPTTKAYLVFDDQRRLQLPPGSMVQLDEETIDSTEIHLYEPSEHFAVAEGQDPLTPFPEPETYEWRQSEFQERVTALGDERPQLASLVPMTRMGHGPMQPVLGDFEISLAPITPNLSARDRLPGRPNLVRFHWSPIPVVGVRYEVQVSRDAEFQRVTSYLSATNEVEVALAGAGTYYWRVIVLGQEERSVSAVVTFEHQVKAVSQFQPKLVKMAPLSERGRRVPALESLTRGSASELAEGETGLRKEEVDLVVQGHVRELKLCVESYNRQGRSFQGKVFLNFSIDAKGQPVRTDLKSDTPIPEPLEVCLKKKVGALKFKPPRDGQEVDASYPLVFATIQEE